MFPTDQILQGDCTRVLRTLPDASVDLVVTDPPYGVRYRDRLNRTIANDDHPERILGAFNDVYRVLKPDTFCVSFYGWNRRAGFVPVGHIVWQKTTPPAAASSRRVTSRRICSRRAARRSPPSR
jgi:adenine-specific DNA-methyltransferase